MKCPKCSWEGCKYIEPRKEENKKPLPRTDFKAKCKKCRWEGEI